MNLIQQLEKEQIEKLSAGKEIPEVGQFWHYARGQQLIAPFDRL